jgi:hypothetical protein
MPSTFTRAAVLTLLCLFGMAGLLRAQTGTSTALTVTNTSDSTVTSVPSGTIVVLTASVTKTGGGNVTLGTVNFCDTVSPHCEDEYLAGSAQLRSNGTAILKFKPAPGEHVYQAFFHGTTSNAASVSSVANLTVTAGPFATTTTIAQSGSAGNYTLTATLSSSGEPPLSPSGPIDFLDTTNSNFVLGSVSPTGFTSTPTYAPFVGYNPGGNIGVLVADFNQDGIPDLLVWGEGTYVYGGNNYVAVLLGKGDGTYQSPVGYNFDPNADSPSAVAVWDLNGDGYPDVVMADNQTSKIYVLLNSGNGDGRLGWQYQYSFPAFTDPEGEPWAVGPVTGIAIGDVNGDGKPDLAITLSDYGDLSLPNCGYANLNSFGVMLGNGDGSFQTTSSEPYVTARYPSGFCQEVTLPWTEPIELVDTRGSGKLDVVVTDLNHGGACVSLNNGDGTFAGPTCYSAPAGQSVAVGDLNGDGFPDLVVSSWYYNNGPSAVLLGKGDGTFQAVTSTLPNPEAGISAVVLADLNGDGKLDAVLGNPGAEPGEAPGSISVAYGNGDGTFGTAINYNATIVGDAVDDVAVGDLNGDGVLDLIAVDSPATVNVMLGSLSTTATATLNGVSPVGPASASHAVEASYPGDDYYSASTSATTSLTAQPVATTLALQSNVSTVTVGGLVTLTGTISPGSAQGHSPSNPVTFYMNSNSIGTATPSNGVAVMTTRLSFVQTDSFTATYAGDSNFVTSSTTSPVSVTVQQAATALSLQICSYTTTWICPATTSNYGGQNQVTATLSPYNVTGGSSTDGETVTFYNHGTFYGTATLMDGGATLSLDQIPAGSYSFTASYPGDTSFIASNTSSAAAMTVAKVTPSVTFATSPVGTTTYGQDVFLTATFNTYPYVPDTDSVTFYNGTTSVGTALFSGNVATLKLSNLAVGSYSYSASYPGDSNWNSTNTNTAPTLTVQQLPTALTITSGAPGAVIYGTPITLQASLEPNSVLGGNSTNGESITFYQNGTPVGSGTLSKGNTMFTVNVPLVGNDSFTASYAGDTSFGNSTTSQADTIDVLQAPTTMGITTNGVNGYIGSGQPITLTATVSTYPLSVASTNGDTVTFYQGSSSLGTGSLSNGVATFTIPSGLAEGTYTFSASYSGDTNFNGSSSSPDASLTVLQSTTLTLTTNPANFAAVNQAITITATLSPYTVAGQSTNGELVILYNGANNLANAPLVNGVATFNIPNGLPEGSYSFTALYQGDAYLAGSDTSATPLAFSVATVENFVVNVNTDDGGPAGNCTPQSSTTHNSADSACSLRDALLAAANAPEGANITFDTTAFAAPTTIALTNGTLTVPANTTLTAPTTGSGANQTNLVTVDGGGTSIYQPSSTIFAVTGAGTSISNLIISGGWLEEYGSVPANGGGILNSGVLTLTNSTITNNGTVNSGGGIYNSGTLTVIGSTIAGNSAGANGPGNGGGIDNENNGTLNVVNSTIANNQGPDAGIAVGSGTATITNTTISGNSAVGGSGGIANKVFSNGEVVSGGTISLANSIVSGNSNSLYGDIWGSYTDTGGNDVGVFNEAVVDDPNSMTLGPLGNYGGPTQTMLPLPGSSAICAGSIYYSPAQWQPQSVQIDIDQRGYLNYNLVYGQLRNTSGPLPSVCVDSGSVQTNYTAVQIAQSSYTGVAGGVVAPTVAVSVTENGANRGAVPVTLSYSGAGNLSGNNATTVAGSGATFPSLSVDTAGSGSLNTTMIIAGSSYINASASLTVLPALVISPGGETFSAAVGIPFSQGFAVSNGSGDYQLTSSGTLPAGLTLTPPGTATGTGWTLIGTPSQDGTFNFTLTATDVTNSIVTISQSYTLIVAPSTTTTLAASPVSSAPLGQTVTLTATVSSPTANGTVSFFDGGSLLGSGAVSLSGGTPNVATIALNASTLGAPLSFGSHSFTAQFSGDANDAASNSNTVPYNVIAPNLVVNTILDDDGSFTCTTLASTTSNTTDGNNNGNPGQCTLRDALNTASGLGAGTIYFDTTVFAASNLVNSSTANTIYPNITGPGSLSIPWNTTIQGLTSGSGGLVTNLVTVDGSGPTVSGNGTIFVVNGSNSAINNLNINNGYASNGGSGGAITNTASFTVSGSSFTGNEATGSGGAIFNAFGGTLTVVNSTFASNSTTGGNGGAIDNSDFYGCGITTVSSSTFYQNSAANGGNGNGGAINNDSNGPCQVTVNSSTIVGNSTDNGTPLAGFSNGGGGGGIYSDFLLYLANNVITGNTINGSAEDDVDDNLWDSNYWTGNNITLGNNIINGNLIGIWDGEPENGLNVNLAPLGNYGGPMQTMIPLPGSVAICAGLTSNIASGTTTDQRGDPLQPTGGYCPSGTVDAGSVQTNYAIGFSTQPPASTAGNAQLSPAPVVTLSESGSLFTAANAGAVNMTDSAGLLGGITSEAVSSGVAGFNDLVITAFTTDDILTATLPLNPPINLTAQATTGISVVVTPATLSPSSGTLAISQPFTWSNGAGPSMYQLLLGTSGADSSDLYRSGATTNTLATVTIPSNGVTVFATLRQLINGVWQSSAYTFTEPGTPTPATLTPSSGALSTSQTFTWSNGVGPSRYLLQLGTSGFGSTDILSTPDTTATTATVTIPSNGVNVYAAFYQLIDGAWQKSEYTFTEPGTPTPATLSPTSGMLPASQTFTWSNGVGPASYQLLLGTSGPNSSNLYNSGPTTNTSVTVTIPSDGVTVFATLRQLISGVWQSTAYTFTEAGTLTPATLTPSSGLLATSQTFTWSNGVGPAEYQLLLGTNGPDSSDLHSSGATTNTSATVTIPSNGVTVFATLRQLINGAWQSTAYTFTEPGTPTPATLTPSSGMLSTSQTFTWSNGVGPSRYLLQLGTSGFGSTDILSTPDTTATTATVTIPSNGVNVYATFYQLIDGAWQKSEYTFTEPGTPTPATLSPSSGTLATSQTFTWSNGAGPAEYVLLLGTAGAGTSNLYNSQVTTATSATVAIPSNEVTVYATFKQLIDGAWQVSHYTFTEP